MRDRLGNKIRLQHIVDAILEIESYTSKKNFDDFVRDSLLRAGCVRQLEIIGEAAGKIQQDFWEKFPEIEWNEIIGLRIKIAHEYFGLNNTILWEIIEMDLPMLKSRILEILNNHDFSKFSE